MLHVRFQLAKSRLLLATTVALIGASGAAAQVKMSLPGARPAMAPRGAPARGGPAPQRSAPPMMNRPSGFQQGGRPMNMRPAPTAQGRAPSPVSTTTNVVLPNGGLVFRPQAVIGPVPMTGGVLEQPSGIVHTGFGQPLNASGLTINGKFTSDHWKVGFHVGAGGVGWVPNVGSDFCWPVTCRPICPPLVWPANPYWGFPWWGYSDYAYDGYRYDQIYGNYAPLDPALVNTTPTPAPVTETPRPSNDRELGDSYLQGGDAKAAMKSYRQYLKVNPGDAVTMRSMSLALLEVGQVPEAAATMSMAYHTNAWLASVAVSPDVYKGGEDTFRRNLQRMSVYANRTQASSAWLSLAVMMQAEGRNDQAKVMLDRARNAGLERTVADRMMAALQG